MGTDLPFGGDGDLVEDGKGPALPRRLLVAGATAAILAPKVARGAVASAIRLHDHTTHTRFVVEITDGVEFTLRRMADPYRLAIDVPGLEWAVIDNGAATGLISNIQYKPQVSGI